MHPCFNIWDSFMKHFFGIKNKPSEPVKMSSHLCCHIDELIFMNFNWKLCCMYDCALDDI